jgi:hypothetical protein
MAEPSDFTGTIEGAEEAKIALDELTASSDASVASLGMISSMTQKTQGAFSSLNDVLNKMNKNLDGTGDIALNQATKFGVLSASIIGSRKALEGLSGIDTSGLNTFVDQFDQLSESIAQSPTFDVVTKGVSTLTDMLQKAGAPMDTVKMLAKQGYSVLSDYAKSFFQSADNALKLQNAFIQLSARTGNLNAVFDKAGNELQNINSLLANQNMAMATSMKATGLNEKAIEQYFVALGSIPKALEETISSGTSAGGTMSMLTATIKLAQGTGRDFNDVVKDLHQSFKDYGLVGESALKFTARFSEISNKFGVELDDVKTGLMGATGAFKSLTDAQAASGNMTEAVSKLMNDYVGGLKEAGMTGAHAVETVKGMTDALAGMRVEQKAFLSAQTGGPGGLMGAFQIEKMIREGKIDEVFDKVRDTMQKQFGKIVTLEEASKSPAAASQLEKQMLLLQRGPLGQIVKSDSDAYRLLETFRARQEGRAAAPLASSGLEPGGLQNAINRGTSIEEKSYSQLTSINNNLAAIRKAAEATNLGTVQRAATIGQGAADIGDISEAQRASRDNLKSALEAGQQQSGYVMDAVKSGADKTTEFISNTITDWTGTFNNMGNAMQAPMDVLKSTMGDGFKTPNMSSLDVDTFGSPMTPGATVAAAPKGMPKSTTGGGTAASAVNPEVKVNEEGSGGRFKVDVTVKVNELANAAAITPAMGT